MNTNLPIFITVLTYIIFNGRCQSARENVAKALVRSFHEYEKNSKDLSAAAKLVQSLKFDWFNEETVCVVSPEIVLTQYPTVIENFARHFSIPNDVQRSLLNAQYTQEITITTKNLKFEKGNRGNFFHGVFAAVKQGDKIDFAYSVYTQNFKLHSTTTLEPNLSSKDNRRLLEQHFIYQAVTKFRSKYANLIGIGVGQYCDAHGNCS